MFEIYSEKPVKVHKGVKIYRCREQIPGTDLREMKDGIFKDCKPKYIYAYKYIDGYPDNTISEVIESIDNIWGNAGYKNTPKGIKEFSNIMNEEV